jgi:hypothetical protein
MVTEAGRISALPKTRTRGDTGAHSVVRPDRPARPARRDTGFLSIAPIVRPLPCSATAGPICAGPDAPACRGPSGVVQAAAGG